MKTACIPSGIEARDERPTVLSLFSGAGGLDVGLEAAGFCVIGCVEQDGLARQTLEKNRPEWPLLEPSEVCEFSRTVAPSTLGLTRRELDLLAAGPPCQPFSKAAQWRENARSGLRDSKAECIAGLVQVVETFLPRVVLLENVQGFTEGRTSALPFLRSAFDRINSDQNTSYSVQANVLDACHYGVPQHRRRSIIIALRDPGEFKWPQPTHKNRPTTAWDAIGDLHPLSPPRALGRWADLLPSIPEGKNYLFHTSKGRGKRIFGYRRRYWSFLLKLAKDKPSWTLPARPAQTAGPFHWENRRLTPKEMMRLQSFPAGWRVMGTYHQQVRQIGNATPPLLAEVVGRAMQQQIFGSDSDRRPTLAVPRRRNHPRARRTSPVPPRFLKLGLIKSTHPGPGKGPGVAKASIPGP